MNGLFLRRIEVKLPPNCLRKWLKCSGSSRKRWLNCQTRFLCKQKFVAKRGLATIFLSNSIENFFLAFFGAGRRCDVPPLFKLPLFCQWWPKLKAKIYSTGCQVCKWFQMFKMSSLSQISHFCYALENIHERPSNSLTKFHGHNSRKSEIMHFSWLISVSLPSKIWEGHRSIEEQNNSRLLRIYNPKAVFLSTEGIIIINNI